MNGSFNTTGSNKLTLTTATALTMSIAQTCESYTFYLTTIAAAKHLPLHSIPHTVIAEHGETPEAFTDPVIDDEFLAGYCWFSHGRAPYSARVRGGATSAKVGAVSRDRGFSQYLQGAS